MNEKYGNFPAYAQSKVANILFSRVLAGILKGSGVTTYSLHPGTIMTEIGKDIPYLNNPIFATTTYPLWWFFLKTLEGGAQTTICCAVDEALKGESGLYYSDCEAMTEGLPPATQNDEDAKKLWELSLKLTGLDREIKT
ncbi:unnamed protein product [Owenia fusiformis]|uniref:Uncharacterized protein n=1 Tax=Owenia fusiformis TaxID=6347 RepID=A0A8J1U1B3_OWEFU|nr:unnamed protein product [Owenia fusiformis]